METRESACASYNNIFRFSTPFMKMEFNCKSNDNLDNLLLAATRQGDVTLLERHLSAVVNPYIYLNRIYNESRSQKCTLLMTACLNGRIDVIRMLLDRYELDLEILNDITFGSTNSDHQIFFDVSVLWAAASINNLKIVRLLVEHGADVNSRTKTNSTPLRGACYNGNVDMARYLIEHGADVNIAKENNDTNLMVSVCHRHITMAAYLVDELKCNVNECDNNGRSSLYDAVISGSVELVEMLLKRGARNFPATIDQMSPLMWAAEKRRSDLVDAISPYCSLLERIEAQELLGTAFACQHRGDNVLEKSFQHFCRALELRTTHNLPKVLRSTANEIFNNRHECETIDQLKEICANSDHLNIEALLVRERLLGSTNAEYRYSLCYRGAVLADSGQYHEAVAYWIYEHNLRQQYSIPFDPKHLRRFASLFSGILYKTKSLPMDALVIILKATMNELNCDKQNFNDNLSILVSLITIASQVHYHLYM